MTVEKEKYVLVELKMMSCLQKDTGRVVKSKKNLSIYVCIINTSALHKRTGKYINENKHQRHFFSSCFLTFSLKVKKKKKQRHCSLQTKKMLLEASVLELVYFN